MAIKLTRLVAARAAAAKLSAAPRAFSAAGGGGRASLVGASTAPPLALSNANANTSSSSSSREACFLMIKPSANNAAVLSLVRQQLDAMSINVLVQSRLSAKEIAFRGLFLQQFKHLLREGARSPERDGIFSSSASASAREGEEAALEHALHVSLPLLLMQKKFFSAKEAQAFLGGVSNADLGSLWGSARVSHVVRKGLVVARLDALPERARDAKNRPIKPPVFVTNGFLPAMEDEYCAEGGAGVTCLVVEWSSDDLSWADFQDEVVGVSDPGKAQYGSIRGTALREWEALGLPSPPSRLNNVLHASASGLAGLAERVRWLRGTVLLTDPLGSRLLAAKVPSTQIRAALEDEEVLEGLRGHGCAKSAEAVITIAAASAGGKER